VNCSVQIFTLDYCATDEISTVLVSTQSSLSDSLSVVSLKQILTGLLTLSSPVMSNGYTSKCSALYWSNLPFKKIFLTFGHSGAQSWAPQCPNVKKLKRVGETSMVLNALVESFLPQSEKLWDWRVNIEVSRIIDTLSLLLFQYWPCYVR